MFGDIFSEFEERPPRCRAAVLAADNAGDIAAWLSLHFSEVHINYASKVDHPDSRPGDILSISYVDSSGQRVLTMGEILIPNPDAASGPPEHESPQAFRARWRRPRGPASDVEIFNEQ